jgi:endonuclease/exonuclease/phosphatase family metal-dependent hydrolase
MQLAYSRRAVQASMIRNAADTTKLPSIICGDFNDVPASYAYFKIKGTTRNDAFLKKSWGVGRTFYAIAPTLRIDYILPELRFEIKQFDLIDENLSDHLLLVADLSLKKDPEPKS